MPSNLKRATLYIFLAYWIVTILGFVLTVLFAFLFDPSSPQELGVTASQAPAYLMTIPYHPLLNLLVWPWFAWLYWRKLPIEIDRKREMVQLGLFWMIVSILVDLIGWVLIPHPWAMTFKEFYLDYQPWITLIYLIIFASPACLPLIVKRIAQRKAPLPTPRATGFPPQPNKP
jgi:hypothetical protein